MRSRNGRAGLTILIPLTFGITLPGMAAHGETPSDTSVVDAAAPVEPVQKVQTVESAAEIDWVPRAQLSPEQLQAIPTYCEGRYVQPQSWQRQLQTAGQQGKAVKAEADEAENLSPNDLRLHGNVEISQGGYQVQSDEAQLDREAGVARMTGQVQARSGQVLLTGDEARYQINSGDVEIENASYLVHEREIRGQARQLKRQQGNKVIIEDGSFTTCHPGDASWNIRASKIELDQQEGVGTATHARFEIADVPVFYVPWYSFPIDDRRKTGFLFPTFGSANTGSGLFVVTPYYLNLGPNYDATVTPQYISGRGAHTELEGRYLDPWGLSVAAGGYIAEDQDYVDENPTEDGDRWGFSFERKLTIGTRWSGDVDYNAISDNDYLRDLNQGIQIEQGDHLVRTASLNYRGDIWDVGLLLQGFQTIDSDITGSDLPYQRLPELSLRGSNRWGGFEGQWQSRYTYFYRNQDEQTGDDRVIGSRLRHTPSLSYPMSQSWGYLTPSVLLDHTDYVLEDAGSADAHIGRTVGFYSLDSGLYFDRSTSFSGKAYNHSLEPRLYYVYSGETEQDDIPNFDTVESSFSYSQLFARDRFSGGDRVGDNNRLTVGLTSRYTESDSGIDRAIFSIGQITYFQDRKVSLTSGTTETRSDSLLAGEMELRPLDLLDIKVSGLWDPRDNDTQEGNTTLRFHSQDYRKIFNLGHRFTESSIEQSDTSFTYPLTDQTSVLGRWLYDFQDKRTIGTLAGLEYSSCCWRVQFLAQSYLSDDSEVSNSVLFRFQLKGLGTLGADANELDTLIPGYKAREQNLPQ